jgi:hypothetical protein
VETVSTKKATDTNICEKKEIESGRNWVQDSRKNLQLPIVVLEMSEVVPGLHEFGHIQKLR